MKITQSSAKALAIRLTELGEFSLVTEESITREINKKLKISNLLHQEDQSNIANLNGKIGALESQLASEQGAKAKLLHENQELRQKITELEDLVQQWDNWYQSQHSNTSNNNGTESYTEPQNDNANSEGFRNAVEGDYCGNTNIFD